MGCGRDVYTAAQRSVGMGGQSVEQLTFATDLEETQIAETCCSYCEQ